MEKRDPLKELGNTPDNNDTQETAKEPKVPEVVISSDKENVHMTENSDPGKAGCGKLRLSFLKTFDPLFSESRENSEVQSEPARIRPQLILEDSDTDRSLSPLPIDVSDDDAIYVDATYIAPSEHDTTDETEPLKNQHLELDESLLKFYTPEKLTTTVLKNITKSTSETARKLSVLSKNKEPVATSVGDQSEESSDSAEEKIYSIGDISDSRFISSEEESNEHVASVGSDFKELEPTPNTDNSSDSLNSDVGEIKDNLPTLSKEPNLNVDESLAQTSLQKEFKTQQLEELEEKQPKLTEKSEGKPSDDGNNYDNKSVVATASDSAEKAPGTSKSVEDYNTQDKQADDFVEADGTENDSDQDSVEEESKDNKGSETDEGFRSSEEKVFEDLNKTNGIEKAETELSEKSQEHVVSAKEDNEEKATCSNEPTGGSSEEESVVSIEKETPEAKVEPEEKEEHLIPDKKAEEEANKTFDTCPSVESASEEIVATKEENLKTPETCASAESVQETKLASEEKEATKEESLETSDTGASAESVEAPKLESEEKEATKVDSLQEEEEAIKSVDETAESPTEGDATILINQDKDHLDSGVESTEQSTRSSADKVEGGNVSINKDTNLPDDENLEEGRVDSDSQLTSDDDSKTLSDGSIQSDQVLSESKRELDTVESSESQEAKGKTDKKSEDAQISSFDIEFYKAKMADLSEKLSEQQQENSDLKLQLNASQQAKATLELEIRQKEEIIIKTQAEALKNEQIYKQEIKQLREKLKENSKLIEKDGSKELEEQLKEAKAREAKAIAELNQRTKDDLNYQKIMEEYENTIATRFADYQKLKEEHETATRHLANIELAFSDVHQKYERTKALLEGFKSNEETLSLSLQASEKTCKQHEERYESLKAHAKAQIEKSNKEILMLRDKYEMDINKFKAIIKRLEIKCSSLEVSLQQKTEECSALSALCDEVTGKRV